MPDRPPPSDPLDAFFSLDAVHEVRIEVDELGVASLLERPRHYVHGSVRVDDSAYDDVAVRLKGGAGSFVPLDGDYPPISGDGNGRPGKSAFIIDFNRYESGVDHMGLEKLTLNNLNQDPSGIHEYLGYALFRAGDVPASRSGFGRVWFNGEEKGLYALIESPDNDELLERWYGSSDGNLYEGEYGADLNRESIGAFDQDNGRDDSRRDLELLVAALDGIPDGEDPLPTLEEHLDVDRYLAYAATELFLGHWDGYAWSTNNYMIHHEVPDGPWTFVPWGIDQLFEDPLGEYGGVMRELGPSWAPGPGGRIHTLCFDSPECKRRLAGAYEDLLARVDAMDLTGMAWDARSVVEPLLLDEAEEFGDPALTERALDQVPRYIEDHVSQIEEWVPCLDGRGVDHDRDGFDGCTVDCDDFQPLVHPGAEERCNLRDDDCNGRIDDPDECPKCVEAEGAALEGASVALCFEPQSWPDARSYCTDRGGELVSFHDPETFELVTFQFMERVGVGASWIGLNDRAEEGAFSWTDGSPLDFERWSPYAPRPDGEDTDCVLSREFGWVDIECGEPHAFICAGGEVPAPPN
ncbi:MAG: CotH kinase family protein [Anaerolineae bacterium]